jgi:hypothetical protein
LLPLLPLILFNVRTGGTLASLFGNLGQSYYGVDNSAYWPNLLVRLNQLGVLLRGNHLWYLGEVFANNWAPWLAAGLIAAGGAAGLLRRGRRLAATLLPVGLIAFIVAQSAFTVSDLFITHDALFLPLIPLAAGMAAGTLLGRRLDPASGLPRSLAARRGAHVAAWALPLTGLLAVAGWAGVNTANTIAYHRILTRSGGYGSHSDAIYRLADYLEQWAPSAPVVLDWGMDAQLRFLSSGRVNPIEVFGYTGLDAPDAGFTGRAGPFLADPNSRFVAHAAQEEVFHGRVQALAELAARQGLELRPEAEFGLRSGKPLFIVYRAVKPGE